MQEHINLRARAGTASARPGLHDPQPFGVRAIFPLQRLTNMKPRPLREGIISNIREGFTGYVNSLDRIVPPEQGCLYWALLSCAVLSRHGQRAILQAGSSCWPRLRPEQDDGLATTATHFSYVWTPTAEDSIRAWNEDGYLPEMHVWCGLPDTQEIVDVTTCYLKQQCANLLGSDWPGDEPPDFLWSRVDQLPDRVLYRPNREATILALAIASALTHSKAA